MIAIGDRHRLRLFLCVLTLALCACMARADSDSGAERQLLSDAWWTGPLVAPGAATLPKGRALVEPYVYDIIRDARYDNEGERREASRTQGFRSLTYLLYGVTDSLTVGIIPVFGINDAGGQRSSLQLGDVTLQVQYRLTQFRAGSRVPTTSIVLQQSLPTGKYQRLSHPGQGIGTGAYTSTLALRSQYFLWMPNGRILRTRLHASYAMSDPVAVEDVSVYGTGRGFRGRAEPGEVLTFNSSWEYSVTRNWVLALDLVYQRDGNTRLREAQRVDDLGSAWRFGVAPAIEYNWSPNVGLIVGARWYVAGRNANATFTPLAAINMVF